MSAKLPHDAFSTYVALGPDRSYELLARQFGVDKRTVVRRAVAEDWQGRLDKIEADARDKADAKLSETIEAMNLRHLRVCRVIQAKALEALKAMPLDTAMNAVRALDISVKHERLIRGEPTDRAAVSVEDVVKREYDRWLTNEDEAQATPALETSDG